MLTVIGLGAVISKWSELIIAWLLFDILFLLASFICSVLLVKLNWFLLSKLSSDYWLHVALKGFMLYLINSSTLTFGFIILTSIIAYMKFLSPSSVNVLISSNGKNCFKNLNMYSCEDGGSLISRCLRFSI